MSFYFQIVKHSLKRDLGGTLLKIYDKILHQGKIQSQVIIAKITSLVLRKKTKRKFLTIDQFRHYPLLVKSLTSNCEPSFEIFIRQQNANFATAWFGPQARAGLRRERKIALHQLHRSLENDENMVWDKKARELEEARRGGETVGCLPP